MHTAVRGNNEFFGPSHRASAGDTGANTVFNARRTEWVTPVTPMGPEGIDHRIPREAVLDAKLSTPPVLTFSCSLKIGSSFLLSPGLGHPSRCDVSPHLILRKISPATHVLYQALVNTDSGCDP